MQFYERLEAQIKSRVNQAPAKVTAQSFELVDPEPLFGFDAAELDRWSASDA